ncbi:hypothetical protein I316_05207 [Kwoniella heveanensis BCC8398]|uniref:Uncharacterized protein n=1 Tax=Kwoniella heveanensis BCC8398 TaxID=1296120 RepID=A0A1B9GQ25_9TREE|nr:hypothetical protein I316_05207 [Kwoniella heveanensis BCC8398]
MSASSSRITSAQLKPIIRSLPASPLSDKVQLSDALELIADRALAAGAGATAGAGGGTTAEALRIAAHQKRLSQMRDSIVRIRSGHAMKLYPLSKTTLSPPNDPYFYTRMRNAFHNAAKGLRRPWWKIFFNVKGAE